MAVLMAPKVLAQKVLAQKVLAQRAEAAAQADASSRKTDLFGFVLLATIVLVMTAWIGGLVWAAIAFLTWLVS